MIAAALGNITATEEMLVQSYDKWEWDSGWCERVGDILTIIAKQNLEAAVKLWKVHEKQVIVPLHRALAAARILDNLGPMSSPYSAYADFSL